MATILDLLNESAGGQFMAQMARQFAISPEQVNAGMAALMPAFSEGFRRSATDPAAFFKLMQMFARSQQAGAMSQAFTPAGIDKGNEILGEIFGTKELSRAVAAQAAQAAGLSQTVLKAMLPALAPAILGGLFKTLTGFQQGQRASAGANPFGQILEQMMGGEAGAQNPFGRMLEEMLGQPQTPGRRDQTPAGETQNPWGRVLEEMLGQGKTGRTQTGSDNPLGKMFEEMLGGGTARNEDSTGSARQTRGPKPSGGGGEKPGDPADSAGRGGLEGMIGDMFDTGKTMQKDYQRNMESIFDEFLGGMKKG